MSLDGESRRSHPQVLAAGQPAADGLLDADTGHSQHVRTQLLQVSYLTRPEEDLVFAKLILILILGNKQNMN